MALDAKPSQTEISTLARVLAETPDKRQCEACLVMLPTLANEEMAGRRIADLHPELALHLEICPDCGAAYADLLDILLADERGEFAVSEGFVSPPLPAAVRLQRLVVRLARAALSADPFAVEVLPDVARVFFETLAAASKPLTLLPASAQVLGLGGESHSLPIVAAAYQTVSALLAEQTVDDLKARLASGQLESLIKERARAEAQASGLSRQESDAFASAVVREVMANFNLLMELAQDVGPGAGPR